MQTPNKTEPGSPPPPNQYYRFEIPLRVWLTWLVIIGALIALLITRQRLQPDVETISQSRFMELLDSGRIVRATVFYNPQNNLLSEIKGAYGETRGGAPTEVQ